MSDSAAPAFSAAALRYAAGEPENGVVDDVRALDPAGLIAAATAPDEGGGQGAPQSVRLRLLAASLRAWPELLARLQADGAAISRVAAAAVAGADATAVGPPAAVLAALFSVPDEEEPPAGPTDAQVRANMQVMNEYMTLETAWKERCLARLAEGPTLLLSDPALPAVAARLVGAALARPPSPAAGQLFATLRAFSACPPSHAAASKALRAELDSLAAWLLAAASAATAASGGGLVWPALDALRALLRPAGTTHWPRDPEVTEGARPLPPEANMGYSDDGKVWVAALAASELPWALGAVVAAVALPTRSRIAACCVLHLLLSCGLMYTLGNIRFPGMGPQAEGSPWARIAADPRTPRLAGQLLEAAAAVGRTDEDPRVASAAAAALWALVQPEAERLRPSLAAVIRVQRSSTVNAVNDSDVFLHARAHPTRPPVVISGVLAPGDRATTRTMDAMAFLSMQSGGPPPPPPLPGVFEAYGVMAVDLADIQRGIRRCAWCGGVGSNTCSRCRRACYCSAACQKSHWPTHKLSGCGK
jgi:hypothetical protein